MSTGGDEVVALIESCLLDLNEGLRSAMTARRQYGAAAFAEADAACAIALAIAAKHDAVAVLEERARLAVGKNDRLLAALAEFEQRAGLVGLRPGQRAGAEQIASLQVAAVDRVMRDHLRNGPVRVVEVGRHQALARVAGRAHLRGLQPDLELDIERAGFAVDRRVEIGQRLRIAR